MAVWTVDANGNPVRLAVTATGASGGTPPPDPVDPGGQVDPYPTVETLHLPFDMPERQYLVAASRKVYAHYFTPYPRSINNTATPTSATDWYHARWIGRPNATGNVTTGNPDGAGTPNNYGGLLRDRPLTRNQRPSGWAVADKVDEVNWARDAGFDGWMLDMLGIGSGNNRWQQQIEMHDAIEASGHDDFHLGLMPDGNSSATNSATALADAINLVRNRSSTLRTADGRLVVSPYKPESRGAAYWQGFVNDMQTRYGEDVYMVPCFEQPWSTGAQAPAFASFSDGFGRWGDRDPVAVKSSSVQNVGAMAHMAANYPGKIWMHPVAPGDERPVGIGSSRYWERRGLESFRAAWEVAIDTGAHWVQVPTWNDISEHSHIVPSLNNGYSYVDIAAYYITRFKLGYWPTIKRDAGYLSHRIRPSWSPPTNGQTSSQVGYGMTQWQARSGSTPHVDEVELLTFLTAPATVQITSGGTTQTSEAPAGLSRTTKPIGGIGPVSARITRGGVTVQEITSPQEVVSTPWVQDMAYRTTSGLRQALGQHPTTAP